MAEDIETRIKNLEAQNKQLKDVLMSFGEELQRSKTKVDNMMYDLGTVITKLTEALSTFNNSVKPKLKEVGDSFDTSGRKIKDGVRNIR